VPWLEKYGSYFLLYVEHATSVPVGRGRLPLRDGSCAVHLGLSYLLRCLNPAYRARLRLRHDLPSLLCILSAVKLNSILTFNVCF